MRPCPHFRQVIHLRSSQRGCGQSTAPWQGAGHVPRDSASRQHRVSAFPFCTENLGQTQPLPSQPQDQKRRTITRNWISFTPPPLLPRSLRFPQHCTPLRARRAWLSPAPHSYEVLPAAHTSTWKPHRRPEPFYRQFSLLFFPWLHKDKKKLRY